LFGNLSSLPLAILGILSATLIFWQWRAASRFARRARVPAAPGPVPISVLKPLKGCDAETEACLESWLNQDHAGPVQVLFGLSTPDDPAAAVVQRLIARYPGRDLSCTVASTQAGTNEKVAKLIHLERLARHDLLVVSDADVRVPADLLRQLAHDCGASRNTLVCCLYRLANPSTLAMQWEAVSINSDFWSQVLQARTIAPLDFALGATMGLHREALRIAGGFEGLADQLADDYLLGHRLVQRGGEVRISPAVVECWESPRGWRKVWRHQLRWARTIRVCRPLPYFLSILANGTLWPLVWLAFSNPWVDGRRWVLPAAIACLLFRAITARDQQRRLDGGSGHRAPWWMPWFKDLAQVFLWFAAFLGNTVEWRGERYRVSWNGRLTSTNDPAAPIQPRAVTTRPN
jgi:ceramide glucosyltransferase